MRLALNTVRTRKTMQQRKWVCVSVSVTVTVNVCVGVKRQREGSTGGEKGGRKGGNGDCLKKQLTCFHKAETGQFLSMSTSIMILCNLLKNKPRLFYSFFPKMDTGSVMILIHRNQQIPPPLPSSWASGSLPRNIGWKCTKICEKGEFAVASVRASSHQRKRLKCSQIRVMLNKFNEIFLGEFSMVVQNNKVLSL